MDRANAIRQLQKTNVLLLHWAESKKVCLNQLASTNSNDDNKIQNLTANCCIVKLIPLNVVILSHLYNYE